MKAKKWLWQNTICLSILTPQALKKLSVAESSVKASFVRLSDNPWQEPASTEIRSVFLPAPNTKIATKQKVMNSNSQ